MKYYLSVLAIFKNEGHCINEWLEHYISEGVEHFYLIDNGSNDNYQLSHLDKIDLVIDPTLYNQVEKYNRHYLDKSKESEWVIIVDLDEFIYSRINKTISETLRGINDNIEQIGIPCKTFGSSGFIHQPDSLVNSFLFRHQRDAIIETKCIVRRKYLTNFGMHISFIKGKTLYITGELYDGNQLMPINENILKYAPLHLNHYKNQSFEWYRTIKMTRGDADALINISVRSVDIFNKNEEEVSIIDAELCNKKNKIPNFTNDIVVYGVGNNYYDITNFEIDFNKSFNAQFDDPIVGERKYLIVCQDNKLRVYDEV
jgi:hypothetical protein